MSAKSNPSMRVAKVGGGRGEGPTALTKREAEVLLWISEGKRDAEIGSILGISTRTAQKHVERIRTKLGVETRTAAAAWALERWQGGLGR